MVLVGEHCTAHMVAQLIPFYIQPACTLHVARATSTCLSTLARLDSCTWAILPVSWEHHTNVNRQDANKYLHLYLTCRPKMALIVTLYSNKHIHHSASRRKI